MLCNKDFFFDINKYMSRKKEYCIKAYFKSFDQNGKKLHMSFLNDEVDSFTRTFLYSYYSTAQTNPIKHDEFYIKYDKNSLFFLDKAKTHLMEPINLVETQVNMSIQIKHYNFINQQGKKIIGWNIYLRSMYPI
jgi:hypothetical protein